MSRPVGARVLVLSLAIALTLASNGCEAPSSGGGVSVGQAWDSTRQVPQNEPQKQPAQEEPSATKPVVPMPAAPAIATVNGIPLPRADFESLLIESYGLDLLELQIRVQLARSAVAAKKLAVGQAEIRAEYERALAQLVLPAGASDTANVNMNEAEALLDQMLRRNHVSRKQFMLKVEMDACHRALAEHSVTVTDDLLPAEYERTYGERVRVRHIQLDSLAEAQKVRDRLNAGDSFADLAKQFSRNTVTGMNGGLLPPFSRYDEDVPPLLRDTAFALSVGQVSNVIQEDGSYQIIQLDARYPASSVDIEYVKDELRRRVRRRLVQEAMVDIASQLFDRAKIEIHDPMLRSQFRSRYLRPAGDR